MNRAPVVLASASPRRRELLSLLLPGFLVEASGVPEEVSPGAAPANTAVDLAVRKAESVASGLTQGLVLGADTVIDLDGETLGKPVDPAEASGMLSRLAGRAHRVWTAVALVGVGTRVCETGLVATTVWMHPYGMAEIAAYIETGEPMDKAGAYAIQGWGGKLVAGTEGCFNNVVGLPLCEVWRLLVRVGERERVAIPVCPGPNGSRCPRLGPLLAAEASL